jgi:rhamnulokinase
MGESPVVVAAVDLGASSGRVVVGEGGHSGFTVREVYRFANRPIRDRRTLRWDAQLLRNGVLEGLRRASLDAGHLDAVSVDAWAVDFGLLDAAGELVADPVHYRDSRTLQPFADVTGGLIDGVDPAELYATTGVSARPFNTVFQLMAARAAGDLASAQHALMIPDLMTYWLSGELGTELTNASTTQLLDPTTMTWASAITERLRLPMALFPPIWRAGQIAGTLAPRVAAAIGADATTQVVVGPSHDTAAAVAGVPAEDDNFAFVCTGTWALVGLELPAPVITEASRVAGFNNEIGVDGSVRFLRVVTGFWLLQECEREWQAAGEVVDRPALTRIAAELPAGEALIDVQDPGFTAPDGMTRRIVDTCRRTSGVKLVGNAQILRCILDSMAVAIRHAIRDAMRIANREVTTIHVVGGAVASPLFCQLVADACGRPVIAGPVEAASWGNVFVQARAVGAVDGSLRELRAMIRRAVELTTYSPRGDETRWQRAEDVVLAARESAGG